MDNSKLNDQVAAAPVARKKRRWMRWILLPLAVVVVLVLFAPTIVCVPAVRDMLLRKAVPADAGTVDVTGLSVGWFSGTEIRGLRYVRGTMRVETELVKCDRTLVDLARNWSNLGKIEIVAPNIVVDPSSATESKAGPPVGLPAPTKKQNDDGVSTAQRAARPINAEIAITKGKVTVLGATGKPQWIAESVECTVKAPRGCTEAAFDARAVARDGQTTVPIVANAKMKWPLDSLPGDLIDGQLTADGIDLAAIQAMLASRGRDVQPRISAAGKSQAEFAGMGSVEATVRSDADGGLTWRAKIGVKDFAFVDAADGFELREPELSLVALAVLGSDSLRVEQVQLVAAGMKFDASGQTRWPVRSIATDLVEGHLNFSGIPLRLVNPFLDRDDAGDETEDRTAPAGIELGGTALGAVDVRPGENGAITSSAKMDVSNFVFLDRANKVEIREPKLAIRAAAGVADDTVQVQTLKVDAGRISLDASGSAHWPVRSIVADLVEGHVKFAGIDLAMANPFLNAGAAASPAKRLELAGVAQGTADVLPAGAGAIAAQAKLAVSGFSFFDAAHEFQYREPKVNLTATGTYGGDSMIVDLVQIRAGATSLDGNARLHGPITSFASDLEVANVEFAGLDLRLANAFLGSPAVSSSSPPQPLARGRVDLPPPATGTVLAGVGSGKANLRPQPDGSLAADAIVNVKDFSVFLPSNEFEYRDPQIKLTAAASMTRDTAEVRSLKVQSASLNVDAAGRITELTTATNADLAGTFQCDWRSLQAHMSEVLPKGLSLAGNERRPWLLRGPLAGKTGVEIVQLIQADVGTRFEFPEFFGLDLAPVEFAAKLASGELRVEPLRTTLEGGKVFLRPTVTFADGGPVARVASGRLLDRMVIDKTLCDNVLRFVNPLIAGRGDLSGQLSLDVDRFELPLGSDGLEHAYINGKLALDNAQFRPDDTLVQILNVAGIRLPANIQTSQSIAVRMEDGRIYHSGLRLPIGDEFVVLDGSVGLDHTLQLVVDVPLGSKLAGNNASLQKLLRGQRVQVPVSGTLERIRFDQNAIASNVQKMIQTSLRDALPSGDDLINGLLKKAQKK